MSEEINIGEIKTEEISIGEILIGKDVNIGEVKLEEIKISGIVIGLEQELGEIQTEEINIGDLTIGAEIEIGAINIDVQKVYPELEDIEVTPTAQEQNFKSKKYGFENVKVKAIPEEYIVPKVIEKTLVLSRVNVDEGRLIL